MNFLISQNESSAQHVTIARYDMKNPIKIVNLLICMDFQCQTYMLIICD